MAEEEKEKTPEVEPTKEEAKPESGSETEVEKATEVEAETPKKSEPKKTVVGPLLIFLLITNSFFAIFIYYNQKSLEKAVDLSVKERAGDSKKENKVFKLHNSLTPKEDYIIEALEFKNIQANFRKGPGPKRYLALSFTLLVETPKQNPINEINSIKAQINDRIYSMTNDLTHKDLLKLEGREIYKQLLLENINQLLRKDRAVKVLYQKFLVR